MWSAFRAWRPAPFLKAECPSKAVERLLRVFHQVMQQMPTSRQSLVLLITNIESMAAAGQEEYETHFLGFEPAGTAWIAKSWVPLYRAW
jgi:hypothetical protein